jgi:hypothetical protein
MFKITDGLRVGTIEVIDVDGKIDHARLKNIPTLAIAGGGTGSTTPATAIAALGGLPTAGGTMTGFITLHSDPTQAMHPATKQWVEGKLLGLDPKESVRVATTANITLSAPQTIDGIAVIAGDRVLVKNQSTASQNGIYIVAAGAWTRAPDADASAEVTTGMYMYVEQGTTNGTSQWYLTTTGAITLGTTSLTFSQFSGAGQITAGAGMTKTGNTLDVVGTANRITVNADSIDIAATYVGQTSITTLGTITSGTWTGTTIAVANGGTGATNAATALSNLGGAPLASPALTGTPTAPTAAGGTNNTQIATTAFVVNALGGAGVVTSFNTRTGAVTLTTADVTGVLGGATLTGNLTATQFLANSDGTGENFRVGNDVWIGDYNTANSLQIKGVSDPTKAFIKLGNSASVFGYDGANLVYGGNAVWYTGNVTNQLIANTFSAGAAAITSTFKIKKNNTAINFNSFAQGNLEIATTDGSPAMIGLHREGFTALTIYHDAQDSLRVMHNSSVDHKILESDTDINVNKVIVPLGTVSAPSITFTGDDNTGIYSSAANTLAFTTGGAVAATLTSSSLDVTGHISAGSASYSSSIVLNIAKTYSADVATKYGLYDVITIDNTVALTANRTHYGTVSRIIDDLSETNRAGFTHTLYGVRGDAQLGTTAGGESSASVAAGLHSYVLNHAATGLANDLRGSYNYIVSNNALGVTAVYGAYNWVQATSTFTGTIAQACGTYNRLDRDAGTITLAYGVYNTFEGTLGKKIGVMNVGAPDLDLAASSTASIIIGHYNTGTSTATPRLTINTSGDATFSGTVYSQQYTAGNGDGKGVKIGDVKLDTVDTTRDDLIIRANSIRFGSSSAAWSNDTWAGLKWDDSTKTLYIGGPRAGSTYWPNDAGTLADTTVNFVGLVTSGLKVNGNTVWHSANDGSGSGLDADLLDGLNSASFLRSDNGTITLVPNLVSGPIASSMALSDSGSSIEVKNNGGTGDGNCALVAFHCTSQYARKLGLRADGTFGLGGWSSNAWQWYVDASGNMLATGNVTAYSDPRLKENFQRVVNPLGILRSLDGGTFNWKHGYTHTAAKAGKRDYGILADQVGAVMPEIVTESIEIEGESYKTVAYEKLVPVLIEAVKTLEDRISALEARLAMVSAI